jgi:hypothetical protein
MEHLIPPPVQTGSGSAGWPFFKHFRTQNRFTLLLEMLLGLSAIRESRRHPVRAVARIIFRNGKGKGVQWRRMQASGMDLPVL